MLAGGEKSRVDNRTTAMLRGKMRDRRGVRPIRIGDLSPRGLLVVCENPPERGEIVDITVNGHHIVGEARWSSGRRCGMRADRRINVQAVMTGRGPEKRFKGQKIETPNDPSAWSTNKQIAAYGLLALTAFSTAYLIATYFIF